MAERAPYTAGPRRPREESWRIRKMWKDRALLEALETSGGEAGLVFKRQAYELFTISQLALNFNGMQVP